ncbi:hypothetical protein NDI44_22860 [Trichocoleus sp. DQ-A3]|uniref:hypothetical protein n=1 Tax=Cyanophyceae TaxID=3028117 RepID=UPI001689C921|nr:hypothetical protein [Coleofasciculus sp. FACHB-125]MBD1903371.1 hypothetical protein [Coleofasciculus sp. FACHB-125]
MALIDSYDIGELHIEMHSYTSDVAQHPGVRIEVPMGYRVLGGGATVNWDGQGNLLTSIYPDGDRVWVATSKDHKEASPASITGYCIAGRMKDGTPIPGDDYLIVRQDSVPANHPSTEVVLPSGWILVGGGARANWTSYGSLLFASYPGGGNSWMASAKDHISPDIATVSAYAIGVKQSFLERVGLTVNRKSQTSGTATAHPSVSCVLEHGFRLLSGGAKANWTGEGSLLTASFPQDRHTWVARSKDHVASDPSTITAWCVGIGDK